MKQPLTDEELNEVERVEESISNISVPCDCADPELVLRLVAEVRRLREEVKGA